MTNVIALGHVVATNEPVGEVVAELESLLARAKCGEVRALAYSLADGGGFTMTGWVLGSVDAAVLVGSIARLQFNICQAWAEIGPPHAVT